MGKIIRRLFRLRPEYAISFYVLDFVFRKIFRQNAEVKYPLHHTSTIRNFENLHLGKDTFPGDSPNVYINAQNSIYIGDFTNVGPNVSIVSANHNLYDNSKHDITAPIRIGKNSWIGSHAVILPAVELGENTIVAAGAIVTKSFPEGFQVIGGNPARVLKSLKPKAIEME